MTKSIIDLVELLEDDSHGPTDLTIRMQKWGWKVHSNLFCKQASWFADACQDEEGNLKTKDILIETGSPFHMARLIQFIYVQDYEYYGTGSKGRDFATARSLQSRGVTALDDQLILEVLIPCDHNKPDELLAFTRDEERPEQLTDIDMANLGKEYGCEALTKLGGENLIRFLALATLDEQYRQVVAHMYSGAGLSC